MSNVHIWDWEGRPGRWRAKVYCPLTRCYERARVVGNTGTCPGCGAAYTKKEEA